MSERKSKPINIDVNLHTALKLYCGLKKVSMKDFIAEILTNAIDPRIIEMVNENSKDEITVDSNDLRNTNKTDKEDSKSSDKPIDKLQDNPREQSNPDKDNNYDIDADELKFLNEN